MISNYEDIIHFGKCRFSAGELFHHSCFYTGGKFLNVIYFLLGTINITILPEVTTVGLKPDDVPNLTQRVHSIMENEYEK